MTRRHIAVGVLQGLAILISPVFPRFFLLLESGDFLLLESGDKIILG